MTRGVRPPLRCAAVVAALTALLSFNSAAPAQTVPLPNPSFERGQKNTPTGWRLSGGPGRWSRGQAAAGKRAVTVTGDGEDSSHWLSDALPLEPATLYRLTFQGRRITGSGGTAVSGPVFCNRDLGPIPVSWPQDWTRFTSVFVTPADFTRFEPRLRFGQWHLKGEVAFDDVRLTRAEAVHEQGLGNGEQLQGHAYTFEAPFQADESNASRPLVRHNCGFNTNRWTFGRATDEVVHVHALEGRRHRQARVDVNVVYHRGGILVVEASRDKAGWTRLGTVDRQGDGRFAFPAAWFPAPELFVRLRAEGKTVNLQVGGYTFASTVDGPEAERVGRTHVLGVVKQSPCADVRVLDLGPAWCGSDNELTLQVENPRPETLRSDVVIRSGVATRTTRAVRFAPGRTTHRFPYTLTSTGAIDFTADLPGLGHTIEGTFQVPELMRADYGALLPSTDDRAALWCASSGWKIARRRSAPTATTPAIRLAAARNEAEAVQLVVRPAARPIEALAVETSPLQGPGQAVIPASCIEVLRVRYLRITQPTDSTGRIGDWPDPLPPLTGPIDVPAGTNQPLWIRVRVPERDVPAGDYTGRVTLTARGYEASVPLVVTVFDFTLPDRMTCRTALGFRPENVWRYQGLTREADRRAVLDRYFESFRRHHISPYDPAPLDPLRVTWPARGETDPEKLVPRFDWAAWDRALTRAFDHYRFNTMRLSIPGLGGGSFHHRVEPELQGHGEKTPEYRTLFTRYCRALEAHLREKGWLDKAFVYWFDEPEPRDYAFVMNGFRKLKAAAPGITRMLTEQPEPALFGGPDLWCPVSYNFDPESARARTAEGERFWWYVCTSPRAPYCTLFIDHPAVELRVWLWQTWQRGIQGILVWATNFWTSEAAYPDRDRPQNPYEDPMSWVSGYSTPAGVKRPWGNGDGRFLYPPEAAANGRPDRPVLEGPVESIRWEMLRDGIEDYEYLAMLKRLIEEKRAGLSAGELRAIRALLELPPSITRSLTQFTTDPRPLEARRREVAEAIVKLTRRK